METTNLDNMREVNDFPNPKVTQISKKEETS